MEAKDKYILRKMHRKFVADLDPIYIMDFLYEIGIFDEQECQYLSEMQFRGDRARCFMFLIQHNSEFTMEIFHQALKQNGYGFLSELLKQESRSVPVQRKAEYFSRFRRELVVYRHYLKRLSHIGDHETFENEFYTAKNNWTKLKTSGLSQKRYKAADTYFFALDAWCEYRRVIYDKSLVYSDVFDEMENLKSYLSEENLPEMMRLVRYGSAVLMTNNDEIDVALQYVGDAKSKFDLIHACIETGTVLYIEYNMLCQKYAKTLLPQLKDRLISIAKHAVEHFSLEVESDETVYLDFRRMVQLKLSHLYLGIGMFGIYLNVTISKNDTKIASQLLNSVRKNGKEWQRMETRWKWSYYMAKGRLHGLLGQLNKAMKHTKQALAFAKNGGYSREIVGASDALRFYERQRKCEEKVTVLDHAGDADRGEISTTTIIETLDTIVDNTFCLVEEYESVLQHYKTTLVKLRNRIRKLKCDTLLRHPYTVIYTRKCHKQ